MGDGRRFFKGTPWLVELFNSIMPNNTFTASLDKWTQHRSNIDMVLLIARLDMMSHLICLFAWQALDPRVMSGHFLQVVKEESEVLHCRFQEAARNGTEVDFTTLFRNYSFDVLTHVSLGRKFGTQVHCCTFAIWSESGIYLGGRIMHLHEWGASSHSWYRNAVDTSGTGLLQVCDTMTGMSNSASCHVPS